MTARIGIVGASGYTGGELLRILLFHKGVEVTVATSREHKGDFVYRVHPHLRKLTNLKFSEPNIDELTKKCDLVFLAVPHGTSVQITPKLLEVGIKVVDLSADYRLKDKNEYPKWYGWEHPQPELLEKSVYGLPELHREEIKKAQLVANPGCIAEAAILSMAPVFKAKIVDSEHVVVDAKVSSSGAGLSVSLASHHPEHSNLVRAYKPVMHRHTAEIEQELGFLMGKRPRVALTPHAIEMVRGILTTGHCFLTKDVTVQDLWKMYREMYQNEPFVRIVKEHKGLHLLPDTKNVIGSNFCDVGFEIDPHAGRVVVFGALDNLVKGASGQAVQNMNIMLGFDEKEGLEFPGVRPV